MKKRRKIPLVAVRTEVPIDKIKAWLLSQEDGVRPAPSTLIREYMEKNELTAQAFSEDLGISYHTMVKYKSGERQRPKDRKVRERLEKLTGILPSDWE